MASPFTDKWVSSHCYKVTLPEVEGKKLTVKTEPEAVWACNGPESQGYEAMVRIRLHRYVELPQQGLYTASYYLNNYDAEKTPTLRFSGGSLCGPMTTNPFFTSENLKDVTEYGLDRGNGVSALLPHDVGAEAPNFPKPFTSEKFDGLLRYNIQKHWSAFQTNPEVKFPTPWWRDYPIHCEMVK